jgi:Mycothiol maleylpyruvate isomerase N-terminal domain
VTTATSSFGPRIGIPSLLAHDRAALLTLLRELAPDEWERPTAAAPWVVRDLVQHCVHDLEPSGWCCPEPDDAARRARVEGDDELASTALQIVSIIR